MKCLFAINMLFTVPTAPNRNEQKMVEEAERIQWNDTIRRKMNQEK